MNQRSPDVEEKLAGYLSEGLPAIMKLCSTEWDGGAPCRNIPSVLSALVGLASGSKSLFWEDLLKNGSGFSGLGEAITFIEKNAQVFLPPMSEKGSADVHNAFRELTNAFRGDLMRFFQSRQGNLFLEAEVTKHLPHPLYYWSDWTLKPINHAARIQLVTLNTKLCHEAFFDRKTKCLECPVSRCVEQNEICRCPEADGRKGLLIWPYMPRKLLAFPSSSISVQEAPQEVNTLASGLLDHLGTGVVFASFAGRIVYANSAARELLQTDPVGRSLDEVIPGAEEADDAQKHIKLKLGKGPAIIVGYRSQRCIFENKMGTIVTFRDIGEIVSKNQMRRLSEIGRMTATVAHEVRNPLAGILATMQSVETEMKEAQLGEAFEIIQGEVQRLTDLLDSFFSFVRDKPSRRIRVSLQDLIKGSLRSLGERAEFIEMGELPLQPVWIDPLQMKQVLINLFANGVDALKNKEGRVNVSAELNGSDLRLWVKDDGIGMKPEVLQNAMEPFYSTKYTGTGLGLAVCYQIVEAHDGKIQLESAEGSGTTIEIFLPDVLSRSRGIH